MSQQPEHLTILRRMIARAGEAEALSDEELHERVICEVWTELDLDSRASALLSELLDRFEERCLWPAEIEVEEGV